MSSLCLFAIPSKPLTNFSDFCNCPVFYLVLRLLVVFCSEVEMLLLQGRNIVLRIEFWYGTACVTFKILDVDYLRREVLVFWPR